MNPLSPDEFRQMLDDYETQGLGNGGAVTAPPSTLSPAKRPSALGQILSARSPHDISILEDALSYISPDTEYGTGSIFGPDGSPLEH